MTVRLQAGTWAKVLALLTDAGGNPKLNVVHEYWHAFADGDEPGRASRCFAASSTLGVGAYAQLPLQALPFDRLSLPTTRSIKRLRGLIVLNLTDDPGAILQVGGSEVNPLAGIFGDVSDWARVQPGGTFLWNAPQSGVLVVPSVADTLWIKNVGSVPATYLVAMVGTSNLEELPTADEYLRSFSVTTKPYSQTFGVAPENWAAQMAYALVTVWRDAAGNPTPEDSLLRAPANSAELFSGNSSGSGTYTLAEYHRYTLDRLHSAWPNQPVGFYMAGGFLFAPEYLFRGYQFLSVYPRSHVWWQPKHGLTGGAANFAASGVAIASVQDSGGFLRINFAAPQTIPTGSLIEISGTSVSGYNTICNVTSGATITSGGGTTTSFVVTDLAWVGGASGGTVSGGGRKLVDWVDNAKWADFQADVLEIVDANLIQFPEFSMIWLDETSHPQIEAPGGTVPTWAQRCARLAELQSHLHARGLRLNINCSWHLYSASVILSSDNLGAGGRLRVLVGSNPTIKAGDTVTVSGHSVGTANGTYTVFGKAGRTLILDTTNVGGGTGGGVTNDSVIAQELDPLLASVDGLAFEGAFLNNIRYRAAGTSFLDNLKYLLDNGLAFQRLPTAGPRAQVFTIVSSQESPLVAGRVRYNLSSNFSPLVGARIGIYGHSVAGYNTLAKVVNINTIEPNWIETDQTYTADGTGGRVLYAAEGRIVRVTSLDNTGVGGVVRLHCGTNHWIFPQDPFPSLLLYGPASWTIAEGTAKTPLAVDGQPAKVDLSGFTDSHSSSDPGYLVDVTGWRRFQAALLMALYSPGSRPSVHADVNHRPVWYDWPQRFGAPTGPATISYAGSDAFDDITLIERTFANAQIELHVQENYALVTVGSNPE
jgi:hypothetical protein